jgi:hypothetical protein
MARLESSSRRSSGLCGLALFLSLPGGARRSGACVQVQFFREFHFHYGALAIFPANYGFAGGGRNCEGESALRVNRAR